MIIHLTEDERSFLYRICCRAHKFVCMKKVPYPDLDDDQENIFSLIQKLKEETVEYK